MISGKFSVKSISDVITNSSSEAYIYSNEFTIEKVRNLFNEIIQLVIPDKEQYKLKNGRLPGFDDYFETRLDFFDEEWAKELFRENHDGREADSREELWEWAKGEDEESCDGSRLTGHLIITPKNLKAQEVAKLLTDLDSIYVSEVRY